MHAQLPTHLRVTGKFAYIPPSGRISQVKLNNGCNVSKSGDSSYDNVSVSGQLVRDAMNRLIPPYVSTSTSSLLIYLWSEGVSCCINALEAESEVST